MDMIERTDSLADFVVAEVARQASEEALRAKVQAHIDRAVEDAVKSAFGFGDLNKQIRTAVERALALPAPLDVPAYGTMVLAVLRQKMDEVLTPLVNERLGAEMAEILGTGAREVKLSKLVEEMKGEVDADNYGTHCTVIIEESDVVEGYLQIYLDPGDVERNGASYLGRHEKKLTAAAHVGVNREGKICTLRLDQKDAAKTIVMGAYYGWEKTLFAVYATGGKLVVDGRDGDFDTGYGDI